MDHMTFDEFKEVLAEDLKESLYTRGYEDVEIGFNHTNKANVEYEAMTIKPADGQIGINFNIEGFYQEYEKGVDYSELRHAIADLAAKSLDNAPEVNTNVLTDYEQMKDKLSLEVISKKGNEAFLENIPHKDLEDMAVYYRFVLDVHTNGEMQSITVTNNMLENYGITADKLHEDAIANAPNYRPAVIKTMTDTLREMMGVDMFDMFAEGLNTKWSDRGKKGEWACIIMNMCQRQKQRHTDRNSSISFMNRRICCVIVLLLVMTLLVVVQET